MVTLTTWRMLPAWWVTDHSGTYLLETKHSSNMQYESLGQICCNSFMSCLWHKLQINLAIALTHSMRSAGQPVQALTLQQQAFSRIACTRTEVTSMTWVGIKPGFPTLDKDTLSLSHRDSTQPSWLSGMASALSSGVLSSTPCWVTSVT